MSHSLRHWKWFSLGSIDLGIVLATLPSHRASLARCEHEIVLHLCLERYRIYSRSALHAVSLKKSLHVFVAGKFAPTSLCPSLPDRRARFLVEPHGLALLSCHRK